MIDLRLLGPVEIRIDGKAPPAELLRPKNLSLFVYLACASSRGRSREHLIGTLWPDKPQKLAGHSLNEALRELRRCIGDAAVEPQVDPVRLVAGAVRLDTERFDALAAQGDWAGAAALVAGEFLEGFRSPGGTFEDWLSAERRAWNRRAVEAQLHRADAELTAGRTGAAAEAAHRARALDPLSETALMGAMRALVLDGDRTAALREYEEFCARLQSELSASPGADCVALADRIRRERERGGRARTAPVPGHEGAERRAPLVGRVSELSEACRVWRESRAAGSGATLMLIGDAGAGKTRLADELTARMRLDGALTTVIRAVESDLQVPWSGVSGLARGGLLEGAGLAAAPAPALAWFAERIPEWADRFPGVRQAAPEPSAVRAFSEVLRAALAEQPVVLFVDDAECLDHESLLALDAVVRDLAKHPLCVLLTTTPHAERPELDAFRARVGRDVRGVIVRLDALPAADIKALARWALPSYDDEKLDRLVRRVSVDSAGLPLLVVELVSAVAAGLDLARIQGAWPQPLHTLDETLPGGLPEGVIAALRVGFRRLSVTAQRVLQACAVLEDRVETGRLSRATGLPPDGLAEALDELEWSRWLAADGRGYAFVARIVRQVVAEDLVTPGQRRRFLEAAERL